MIRLGSFTLALCAALFAGHLHAGLVDRYFPGKKDEDLVKEFYKRLPDHLRNMMSTKNPPRALLTVNKRSTVFAELKQVQGKGDTNIWVELLRSNWFTNAAGFAWAPGEAQFYFKNSDIPPAVVASWFDGRTAAPSDVVLLAIFLAKNNEFTLANMRLTEMSEEQGHEGRCRGLAVRAQQMDPPGRRPASGGGAGHRQRAGWSDADDRRSENRPPRQAGRQST